MRRKFFEDSDQKEKLAEKYPYNRIVDLKSTTPHLPWSPPGIREIDESERLQATSASAKDKTVGRSDAVAPERQKESFLNSKEVVGDKLIQQINLMKQAGQRNVHDNTNDRRFVNKYERLNRAILGIKTEGRLKQHFTGEFNKSRSPRNRFLEFRPATTFII